MLSEIVVSFFLVCAGVFALVGSWGLIKLPDLVTRLHGPTKATTLGVGGALIASMLYFTLMQGNFSFHELMISVFLFLTAPITAHFIAKAHIHTRMRPEELPETESGKGWATFSGDGKTGRAPQEREEG